MSFPFREKITGQQADGADVFHVVDCRTKTTKRCRSKVAAHFSKTYGFEKSPSPSRGSLEGSVSILSASHFLLYQGSSNMADSLAPTMSDDRFIDEPSRASPVKRSNSPQLPTHSLPAPIQNNMQSMRRRLDTEETHRIKNITFPFPSDPNLSALANQSSFATDENVSNPNAVDVPSEPDDDTVVSSLSNDEDSLIVARRNAVLSPVVEGECSQRKMLPPAEVEIPVSCSLDDQRDSNMERLVAKLADYQHSPPPILTRSLRSLVDRPTLGRNRSCPVRMDFSVASSMPSTRSGTSYSIPEDSVIINGALIEGIRNRDTDFIPFDYPELLGNRKRRVHRRAHSGTEISVGSIVGQSTLLTAPTSAPSISDSDVSSVRKSLRSTHIAEEMLQDIIGANDGLACCQVRRPKNVVKEELKYVANKLTSPIRMLPIFKEKKAELKRANGSLV